MSSIQNNHLNQNIGHLDIIVQEVFFTWKMHDDMLNHVLEPYIEAPVLMLIVFLMFNVQLVELKTYIR